MKLRQVVSKGDFVKVYNKEEKVLYAGYTNFMDDDILDDNVSKRLGRYDIYNEVYIVE